MKEKLIYHNASSINEYLVECYYRQSTNEWTFVDAWNGKSSKYPHPTREVLNLYYKGDLELWKEEKAKVLCNLVLVDRALAECNYLASRKSYCSKYKIHENWSLEKVTTPNVVKILFTKHLLEKGADCACIFKVTVSWNCDAWYSKTK